MKQRGVGELTSAGESTDSEADISLLLEVWFRGDAIVSGLQRGPVDGKGDRQSRCECSQRGYLDSAA